MAMAVEPAGYRTEPGSMEIIQNLGKLQRVAGVEDSFKIWIVRLGARVEKVEDGFPTQDDLFEIVATA